MQTFLNSKKHLNIRDKKILVMTGGVGPERPGSLLSGKHALEAMLSLGFKATSTDAEFLELDKIKESDFIFLTTHGWYGEDGKLQGLLEMLRKSYSGSGVTASSIAYNKPIMNAVVRDLGIPVPEWLVIDATFPIKTTATDLVNKLGTSIFVKPCSGGCSLGNLLLRSYSEIYSWLEIIEKNQENYFASAYIENGIDISSGIISVNGENLLFPPLKITHSDTHYSYRVKKYPELRTYECPAILPKSCTSAIKKYTETIFNFSGCKNFARVDFIVDKQFNPWFLEVNTLPGLSRSGNFATMANAFGWNYEHLILNMIENISVNDSYRP